MFGLVVHHFLGLPKPFTFFFNQLLPALVDVLVVCCGSCGADDCAITGGDWICC